MSNPSARYDLPWKIALTHAFHDFMAFFFPALHPRIDWRTPPRFRDQELAGISLGATPDHMMADKLVEVRLRDGRKQWVLVHIEVQAQRDAALARRVLDYNYRIFSDHEQPVVLAHLRTQQARHDPDRLYAAKWQLTRLMFQHEWDKERILAMFKVINWMMVLPPPLQQRYWTAVIALNMEADMTRMSEMMEWVTPLEQMFIDRGREKGLEEGREEGRREGAMALLERSLTRRFGDLPRTVRRKLAKADLAQLEAWSDALLEASSLRQIFG